MGLRSFKGTLAWTVGIGVALVASGCESPSSALSSSSSFTQSQLASCTLNGQTVASGQSVTAYTAQSVPYGSVCSSVAQSISCTNGTLSSSGTLFTNCSVTAPASCSFNGASVASGSAVTAYQSASVPFGTTCTSESRSCLNGTLSGSFTVNLR